MSSALCRTAALCARYEQHGRCTPSACAPPSQRLLSQRRLAARDGAGRGRAPRQMRGALQCTRPRGLRAA
eukprot:4128856-Prymnesium_polylepis.1